MKGQNKKGKEKPIINNALLLLEVEKKVLKDNALLVLYSQLNKKKQY